MPIYFQSLLRYASLAILVLAFITFFYFHLYDYLTFSTLQHYQLEAQSWTSSHYLLALSVYTVILTLLIACAIPAATVLTLSGGFLFDAIAILYAEFSITIGGMILFLAVRKAIGSRLAGKSATRLLKRIEAGFSKNAFNYLLTLRLIPIFPCWISNIGAGMLNVPVKTFIFATTLRLLPSTIIYVLAGRGLDKILKEDKTHILYIIFAPSVFFPLLGLAILSLLPVIYKYVKKPDENS